jgi:cell division protein FtsZ
VRGARGILINITGSSELGLHEVNDACTLIRNATQNDDVQVSFGVVVNPDMGDEVKITVIATGFERENLPAIQRRSRIAETVAAPPSLPPEPVVETARFIDTQIEALFEEAPAAEAPTSAEESPESEPSRAMAAAAAPAQTNGAPETLFEDLDVPAILRRDRRFVQ